jgi:hypothetical protein
MLLEKSTGYLLQNVGRVSSVLCEIIEAVAVHSPHKGKRKNGRIGGETHKRSKENAGENYIKIKYKKYKVM